MNKILVSLVVGCSLLFPAVLLVIQAGMSEVCIVDICSPVPNSTDVCTVIPINDFQLPMNVSWWNIFCDQKLDHCMQFCSALTFSYYTVPFSRLYFGDLYWQNYETSHKMWESVI
jgi:hypothetical protein